MRPYCTKSQCQSPRHWLKCGSTFISLWKPMLYAATSSGFPCNMLRLSKARSFVDNVLYPVLTPSNPSQAISMLTPALPLIRSSDFTLELVSPHRISLASLSISLFVPSPYGYSLYVPFTIYPDLLPDLLPYYSDMTLSFSAMILSHNFLCLSPCYVLFRIPISDLISSVYKLLYLCLVTSV